MTFTEEMRRRRKMTPEELAAERDHYFLKDHKVSAPKVKELFNKYLNGLSKEVINHEAWQIVGDFQSWMEHGGFCRWGEQVKIGKRDLVHPHRVTKKDIQSADSNLKKVLKSMQPLLNDPGAWDEFQRKLWDYADDEDKRKTRPDLFVLQVLSGLEMISNVIREIHDEGNLFKRNTWVTKKTRRLIIQRLAFLFEWSRNPDRSPDKLSTFQNFIETMTKTDDWGHGRETNKGNIFIEFAQEVFKALGYRDPSSDNNLSGATIREDINAAIEELKEFLK